MTKFVPFSLLLTTGLISPAFAQEQADRSEIAVSYMVDYPSASTGNGVNQGASASGGILASYRWLFNAHHGVEVDYGYFRDTQQYLTLNAAAGVHTDTHEVSASYVFRMPFGRAIPFLSAGAGALIFDPLLSGTVGSGVPETDVRAAFVYGVGIDLSVSEHLMLRPEYRGLVFMAPSFGETVGGEPAHTGGPMHLAELAVGLVWKL